MSKIFIVFCLLISIFVLGACKSDPEERPFNPISTADGAGASYSSSMKDKDFQAVEERSMTGYANFEDALTDTSYTQSKIPVKGK